MRAMAFGMPRSREVPNIPVDWLANSTRRRLHVSYTTLLPAHAAVICTSTARGTECCGEDTGLQSESVKFVEEVIKQDL